MTDQDKKFVQAMTRATELMIEHGLGDWRVGLHGKRTALATCYHNQRTIRYSRHFIDVATPEQFDGVTLHEIAHALVGYYHHHDAVFKRKCAEISPNTDYAQSKVNVRMHKYKVECTKCDNMGYGNVRTTKPCGRCWRENKERVPFRFLLNELQVVVW